MAKNTTVCGNIVIMVNGRRTSGFNESRNIRNSVNHYQYFCHSGRASCVVYLFFMMSQFLSASMLSLLYFCVLEHMCRHYLFSYNKLILKMGKEGEDGQSKRKEADPSFEQRTRKEEKIIRGEKKSLESEWLSEAE